MIDEILQVILKNIYKNWTLYFNKFQVLFYLFNLTTQTPKPLVIHNIKGAMMNHTRNHPWPLIFMGHKNDECHPISKILSLLRLLENSMIIDD